MFIFVYFDRYHQRTVPDFPNFDGSLKIDASIYS